MSAHTQKDTFPRGPLLGAAGLVVLALTGALLGRLTAAPPPPDPVPLAQRDLRFEDRADGAIQVYQAGDAAPFTVVTGQAGFLRGSLRALVRERRVDGVGVAGGAGQGRSVGQGGVFRLSAWPGGRLTLDDTATGQRIELEAFGSDNAAVYARLLPARGGTP